MNRPKKKTANNFSSSSWEVAASEWRGPFEIQLLPPDIIIDILSRLPIKTILRCRRVCRDWLRLFSHPPFVELQLARSSPAILIKTIPSVKNSRTISLTHVEQRGRAPFCLGKLVLTPKSNLPSSRFKLVNSCNGLLCLSGEEWDMKRDPIWVCNPILGEYVTIPSASKGRRWASFIALGFFSVANRYKVLQTFYPKDDRSENEYLDAEIYDMDTGTWRSIGYAPRVSVDLPFNSLLHGSLHWLGPASNSAKYIYTFNFETEEFGSVPPPPCFEFDEILRQFDDCIRLGVVDGCLFFCVFGYDMSQFDIWVMKDYGVKESWTKQYVIKNLYPKGYGTDKYEPIKFLNNGEILMLFNCWEVVCYNTQTKSFRGTSITRTRNGFDSFAHTPSLVSLYHVVKGELVKRVQGGKRNVQSCLLKGLLTVPVSEHHLRCLPDSTQLRTRVIQRNLDERTE